MQNNLEWQKADQCVLFEEERDKSGDKFQWSMRKDLGVIDVLTQLMIGIFGYKVSWWWPMVMYSVSTRAQ